MKFIETCITILLSVSMFVGCAEPNRSPPVGYSVTIGNGGANNTYGCGFESFESWNNGHRDDVGIYRLLDVRKGAESQAFDPRSHVGPEDNDSISGNFSGLGERAIRDKTTNKLYHIEIIFHTGSDDALLTKMRHLGCIQ
jgi:hypothetical protein